jgi:hypothetical protein
MKRFLSILIISALLNACGDYVSDMLPTIEQIEQTIEKGNFSEAKKMIRLALTNDSLTPADRWEMNFKIERMERIERDFSQKDTAVFNYIKSTIPALVQKRLKSGRRAMLLRIW